MVRADPSLEARALEILERWDMVTSIRSKPLRDEWKRIIAERDWKLALEESDRGQQLRQASPMASLLPEQVRLDIIQSARTMHASKGPRSPWKTHYFVDTEFTDFIDCQLISVAIVGEDGREFYGERTDFELSACSEFVRAAVLPQLGQFPRPLDAGRAIARRASGVAARRAGKAQAGIVLRLSRRLRPGARSARCRNPRRLEMRARRRPA